MKYSASLKYPKLLQVDVIPFVSGVASNLGNPISTEA